MGSMARSHLRNMLPREDTVVVASCEPSLAELELTATEFSRIGLPTPPNEPDSMRFVERFAPELDVIFIITPHVFHAAQTTASLEAGVDVLLEKPMVMNAVEAEALIATRDRTGRLLVIAFPGMVTGNVHKAAKIDLETIKIEMPHTGDGDTSAYPGDDAPSPFDSRKP